LSDISGGTNFTDVAGFALDGEFNGSFPSGNGFAGGNFVTGFTLDIAAVAYPNPSAELPLGSLVYDPSATGIITPAGDTDSFTLSVDPGQTITVLVTPISATLQPTIGLLDPANALTGSTTAAGLNQKALLQTIPTTSGGTYTIVVGGRAVPPGLTRCTSR